MSEDLQLDAEQRLAVEAPERAIAVLAGPGSGKTRVLSFRARHLLANDAGSRALLLTFTNKAAAEMKARALGISTVSSDRIRGHTYHSLCMRVLRSHGSLIGIEADFHVMDDEEQRDFAAKAARLSGVHNRSRDWSSQRLRRVLPTKPVAEFGVVYEEAKRRAGVTDFDDLVVYTAELFRQYPEVVEAYGAKYRHLLIDEFQDTNAAQFEIVRGLAAHALTVSVFADDDQAIFRFAGAEVGNIRRFRDELQARVYPLTINYRCREEIVRCANRLILSDGASSGREMRADKPGGEVRSLVFDSVEQEADTMIAEIRSLIGSGLDPAGIAVLVRSGYRAEVLLDRLRGGEIPVANWLSRSEEHSGRRALRACLAVINPTLTDRAVKGICDIFSILDSGDRETETFLARFAESPGIQALSIIRRRAVEGATPTEVVRVARDGLREVSPELGDSINPIVEAMELFQSHDPEFSLEHMLSELSLLSSPGAPAEVGGVKVASLHRTKGLQWPHVYLLGMENGHIPDYRSSDEEQLREERRLCFVGVCRAEDRLTLTRVRQFRGWDRPPSPYLAEMTRRLTSEDQ